MSIPDEGHETYTMERESRYDLYDEIALRRDPSCVGIVTDIGFRLRANGQEEAEYIVYHPNTGTTATFWESEVKKVGHLNKPFTWDEVVRVLPPDLQSHRPPNAKGIHRMIAERQPDMTMVLDDFAAGCREPSWLENIELRAKKAIKRGLPHSLWVSIDIRT